MYYSLPKIQGKKLICVLPIKNKVQFYPIGSHVLQIFRKTTHLLKYVIGRTNELSLAKLKYFQCSSHSV